MKFLRYFFTPFCLLITTILFAYTFYQSEIYWEGSKRNYYSLYYIISFFGLLFSILSFFFKKKIKDYLIIFSISIMFSFYSFEFYLHKKNKNNNLNVETKFKQNIQTKKKSKIYFELTKKNYDMRSKYEVYEDYKYEGIEVSVTVPPEFHIRKNKDIFPFSGVSNSKTIHCNENGYYSIYQSDRYGFNNPDPEWDKKEIEYLLVGDSFAHGACVNRPDDIASVLRALSKKNVLNLAYRGNGPLIQYASLIEYLNSNVKKVLWIYYEGNDLHNLNNELTDEILKKYINDDKFKQNLKQKQDLIDDIALSLIENKKEKTKAIVNFQFKNFIKLNKLRSLINIILPKNYKPAHDEPQPEFKKILELTKNLLQQKSIELIFVYLPEYERFRKKNNYQNSTYLPIKKIVKDLDIMFLDIYDILFKNETNPLIFFPFQMRGHYNEMGNKKIAEIIFKKTK